MKDGTTPGPSTESAEGGRPEHPVHLAIPEIAHDDGEHVNEKEVTDEIEQRHLADDVRVAH
jgi:hypothetical protein